MNRLLLAAALLAATAVPAGVPEPSTWVMLAIGFGFMAWGASTRRRVRQLVV
jgi:hypothetical protein